MRYRKKPVEIEAVKYEGCTFQETPEWLAAALADGTVYPKVDGAGVERYWIHTLEGEHLVGNGDFVIRGVKGELYPCKPDIFEQTYEKVG